MSHCDAVLLLPTGETSPNWVPQDGSQFQLWEEVRKLSCAAVAVHVRDREFSSHLLLTRTNARKFLQIFGNQRPRDIAARRWVISIPPQQLLDWQLQLRMFAKHVVHSGRTRLLHADEHEVWLAERRRSVHIARRARLLNQNLLCKYFDMGPQAQRIKQKHGANGTQQNKDPQPSAPARVEMGWFGGSYHWATWRRMPGTTVVAKCCWSVCLSPSVCPSVRVSVCLHVCAFSRRTEAPRTTQ